MSNPIYIEAERQGYAIDQVSKTMSVGELIDYLDQFERESQVYLMHDGGYTYGGITERNFKWED